MNRALLPSEMLHCTDMTVLERQKAIHMKWQQQQQQQQQEGCFGNLVMGGGGFQGFEDGCLGEVVTRSVAKSYPGMVVDNTSSNNGWFDLVGFGGSSGIGFGSNNNGGNDNNNGWSFGMNFGISRTSSCPPGVTEVVGLCSKGRDHHHNHQPQQQQSLLSETVISTSGVGRENLKKRKVDEVQTHNTKVVTEEEEGRDKMIKVCAEDGESKITEKHSGNKSSSSNSNKNSSNSKRENSSDTSKDNSKVTEVQKPDYIHVRARRGQATDSHSLAERVRREKISERMKYLQDLVPGCNKITGKAGMLDEIINYVQSLQRQVEFLSMKLSAVNPRLDFNIDNLFAKEAFSACATNFPTIGISSDMTNPAYLQFNPVQQQLVTCGLNMGVNPPDIAPRRSISSPVTLPDTFLDSSCFTQIQASSTWDADLQNLYNVAFDQARPTSYPSQQFTGSLEACNMKMEM